MDQECIQFLQWALPQLDMQWSGFRKVRRQVCKRIQKRMQRLDIEDCTTYRQYLEIHPKEWKVLDGFCRITISRFYRDYYLFDYLGDTVFSKIIHAHPDDPKYSCICLGTASGEEPYTIAIMWKEKIQAMYPRRSLEIIGLEIDPVLLQRANEGVYRPSSLRELPTIWKEQAFNEDNGSFMLKTVYQDMVQFVQADVRTYNLEGPFHLVCCRNLVAMYFEKALQIEIFQKIRSAMPNDAALILGTHERLPEEVKGFQQDQNIPQIYWATESI